jgi:hypothetical protein
MKLSTVSNSLIVRSSVLGLVSVVLMGVFVLTPNIIIIDLGSNSYSLFENVLVEY